MFKEVNLLLLMVFFNIFIQVLVAELIALLVLAILRQLLLHCVVGEMDASVVEGKRVLAGRRADVAFLVPVSLDHSVD